MKLIDKDGLLELIKDLEVTYQEDLDRFKDEELTNPQRYRDTQRGRIEGIIDCYIDIYNAEEIEAIPIHWILHYVDTHYNVDNYDGIWRYIMKMHDDWEEENEKQVRCLDEN